MINPTLKLERGTAEQDVLIGKLYIHESFFCYTLEHVTIHTPPGTYKVSLTPELRYGRIFIAIKNPDLVAQSIKILPVFMFFDANLNNNIFINDTTKIDFSNRQSLEVYPKLINTLRNLKIKIGAIHIKII